MGYGGFGFSFVALDIVVALALVWYLVAWQALIGVCFFLFVSVYGSLAAHKSGNIRKKAAAQTDKRLEIMKEIVAGIRVVKMYAWEWNFRDLVAQIRRFVSIFYLFYFFLLCRAQCFILTISPPYIDSKNVYECGLVNCQTVIIDC